MRDLSLHIMDLAQNSVRAEAKLVRIEVHVNRAADALIISIEDDGCGMPPELLERVRSPFATTRTTRSIGLGIPLFEANAVQSGGGLELTSTVGQGTRIAGRFGLSNIDRPPLGDVPGTMIALIAATPEMPDYLLVLSTPEDAFTLDTREIREVLGEVELSTPEVIAWMRESMQEGFMALLPELCAEAQVTYVAGK